MAAADGIFPYLTQTNLVAEKGRGTGYSQAKRNQLTLFHDPLRVAPQHIKARAGDSLWYMKNNMTTSDTLRRGVYSLDLIQRGTPPTSSHLITMVGGEYKGDSSRPQRCTIPPLPPINHLLKLHQVWGRGCPLCWRYSVLFPNLNIVSYLLGNNICSYRRFRGGHFNNDNPLESAEKCP